MSAHRQHHTPAPLPTRPAVAAALDIVAAAVIGTGIALAILIWSL